MSCYRAAWVLPIGAPVLADSRVTLQNGRIVRVDTGPGDADRDLGRVALLPGLVNAHTHLELSYLREQVPAAPQFVSWIRGVMAARRERPDPRSPEILNSIRAGVTEAVRCGTVLVGDISNTLVSYDLLADSPLAGVLFYEIIRFNAPEPRAVVRDGLQQIDRLEASPRVRRSLAAHAPYSVSPRVFRALAEAMQARSDVPYGVHLSEGREEVDLIATGGGEWRQVLQELGAWDPAWTPAGVSPVRYLDRCGFLGPRLLAVHGVQMADDDLAILRGCGATLVTCPRSNEHTGAGSPPIARFFESGVRVAVGTDSLASTPDLNVFAELAAMRRLAPDVPASRLLEAATLNGAVALGFGDEYGTIAPGKRGRLVAVRVPPAVTDVEEYLVSGIEPEQLFWVE